MSNDGIEKVTIGDDILLTAVVYRRNQVTGEKEPVDLSAATAIRFRAEGLWNGVAYGFTIEGSDIAKTDPENGEMTISIGGEDWTGFPAIGKQEAIDLVPEIETVMPVYGRETHKLSDPADPESVGIQCLRAFGQLLTP